MQYRINQSFRVSAGIVSEISNSNYSEIVLSPLPFSLFEISGTLKI